MDSILDRLTGGDRRSTGRADEVAAEAAAHPELLPVLLEGMRSADPLVCMRAADALEKATRCFPERLQPWAETLLDIAAGASQQEVRWHAAQLIPRFTRTSQQREQAIQVLNNYLQDRSRIVITFSLQALADLARQDPILLQDLLPLLEVMLESPSPAVRSRATRLHAQIIREQNSRVKYPAALQADLPFGKK